jgi:hypothetical protein
VANLRSLIDLFLNSQSEVLWSDVPKMIVAMTWPVANKEKRNSPDAVDEPDMIPAVIVTG